MRRLLDDKPFEHWCSHGTIFKADRCDFRNGVTVIIDSKLPRENLIQDVAEMVGYHAGNIHGDPSSFQGYDAVTYQILEEKEMLDKATKYANIYNASSDADKNKVLWNVLREFLGESRKIAKEKNLPLLVSTLCKQDRCWKKMTELTKGEVKPDGFEMYFKKHFPEMYSFWK